MKKIFRSVSYGLDMPISIGRSNLILGNVVTIKKIICSYGDYIYFAHL